MPDIRERVEADRGLLKRIQLLIPGYAGYRRREDIRAADNLLRMRLTERLRSVRVDLEDIRDARAMDGKMAGLSSIGNAIFVLEGLEAKVRHAEGGYSGISATIRVEEDELDKLYEYDFMMLDSIETAAMAVPAILEAADGKAFEAAIKTFRDSIRRFEDAWSRRMHIVSGTYAR